MRSPHYPTGYFASLLGILLCFTVWWNGFAAALPVPDFVAAQDELVKMLVDFVKIDTSNLQSI